MPVPSGSRGRGGKGDGVRTERQGNKDKCTGTQRPNDCNSGRKDKSVERHKQKETGGVRERQTELQQAKETVTEKDGSLAELHAGNETSYSGLLSAAGSVFNALFMRLQSNSKQ